MTDSPPELDGDLLVVLLRKMAHDIRAPLGAMISTSDMLMSGIYEPLTDKQKRAAERVRRNGMRSLAIVDDFVAYVKAARREYPLYPEPFDPREKLAFWGAAVKSAADEKGLTLTITTHEAVPPTLNGDAAAISRIVLALFWNAIAFTNAGTIQIESDANPPNWIITVRDTGAGIPADEVGHIFEPMWRGSHRTQLPIAGVGLGLALGRALATLMGGTLTLESNTPQGAAFRLTLPLIRDEDKKDVTAAPLDVKRKAADE